jgi:hypothetical protein
MEENSLPLVDTWKTYVPTLSLSALRTHILTAGSGKSIIWLVNSPLLLPRPAEVLISSSVIEDIMALREERSASLTYFYFDFRDEDKRCRRSLLLSILSQLSAQSSLCCGVLSRLYSAHDGGKVGERKPSDGALKQCLKEMLSLEARGPIYLIVDALDECPNNFGMPTAREEVLDLVDDLVSRRLPDLHVCATSRPEIDIQAALEPLSVPLHTQSGQKKDIVDYISSVVYSDTKMRRWRDEDNKVVIERLSEKADGM